MTVLLTVCTANICRSPVAEAVLDVLLERSGITVASAGTQAVDGEAAAAETVDYLRRRVGVDLRHRARRLKRSQTADADLVLTMTAEQRAHVVTAEPRAVRRVFTLRELADIVAELAPTDTFEDLRSFAHGCARLRSRPHGGVPATLDIVDPYGGPPAGYADSFELILTTSAVIARAISSHLRGPVNPGSTLNISDGPLGGRES